VDLKDELTSIMYGADWKLRGLNNVFKPDVEAAMKLIKARDRAREREIRLDEGYQIERLCHENGPYVDARELTYADFMLARDKRVATLTPQPK
jgi:hypothetical protein